MGSLRDKKKKKRTPDPLELELKAAGSCQMCTLGAGPLEDQQVLHVFLYRVFM